MFHCTKILNFVCCSSPSIKNWTQNHSFMRRNPPSSISDTSSKLTNTTAYCDFVMVRPVTIPICFPYKGFYFMITFESIFSSPTYSTACLLVASTQFCIKSYFRYAACFIVLSILPFVMNLSPLVSVAALVVYFICFCEAQNIRDIKRMGYKYLLQSISTVSITLISIGTLSLPSMIMLRKAIKPKLLGLFVGICTVGIIIIGYLFNAFSFLFS